MHPSSENWNSLHSPHNTHIPIRRRLGWPWPPPSCRRRPSPSVNNASRENLCNGLWAPPPSATTQITNIFSLISGGEPGEATDCGISLWCSHWRRNRGTGGTVPPWMRDFSSDPMSIAICRERMGSKVGGPPPPPGGAKALGGAVPPPMNTLMHLLC